MAKRPMRGEVGIQMGWVRIAGNGGEGCEGVDALLDKWGIDAGK